MHLAVIADGGGQVSDETLAAARVRCDPEVFTEVYDRYFRAIYLYVAARLGTGPAEDMVLPTPGQLGPCAAPPGGTVQPRPNSPFSRYC